MAIQSIHSTDSLPVRDMPRCAVMLVLDTSHSMYRGTALADLTRSVRTFCDTLDQEAFLGSMTEVAAVSMGDNLGLIAPFALLADSPLRRFSVRPKGDTPIGGALQIALTEIDAQMRRWRADGFRTVPPQLVVLSDGVSTDDFSATAAEIRRRVAAGELFVRAIALGAGADRAALASIAGNAVLDPLGTDMAGAFVNAGVEVSRGYEHAAAKSFAAAGGAGGWAAGHAFVVDGLNVACFDRHRSGVHLGYVLSLARFMKARGLDYRVYFDASSGKFFEQEGDPGDKALYRQLLRSRPDVFVEVHGGMQADPYILAEAAKRPDSVVISNDRYRDRSDVHPWVTDPHRRTGGMLLDGELFFPDLGWHVPVE